MVAIFAVRRCEVSPEREKERLMSSVIKKRRKKMRKKKHKKLLKRTRWQRRNR